MNDGTVGIPPSYASNRVTPDYPILGKIVTAPQDMPQQTHIKGEVVSTDKGLVTVKTDHGFVTVETQGDVMLKAGDLIDLRLQRIRQQAQNIIVAEIAKLTQSHPSLSLDLPTITVPQADTVVTSEQSIIDAFTPLRGILTALPQRLSPDALEMVIKTLLRLPPQDMLPPSMQEGFDKFVQLTRLLAQTNLLPDHAMQSALQDQDIPQGLLTQLQRFVTTHVNGQQGGNALQQNLIQLQTILPGENLSPNVLVNIRHQLMAVLQQTDQRHDAATREQNGLLASMLSKIIPSSSKGNEAAQTGYTMPAIGLVLGMPQAAQNMNTQGGHLVFMTTPHEQPLIGLLQQQAGTDVKTLLPGTVFVVAFQPQSNKMVTIPLLSSMAGMITNDAVQMLNLALGDTWPALDDLWQALGADPAALPDAVRHLQQNLPAPTPQNLPPTILFFLAAIKNGMAQQWLGDDKLQSLNKADTIRQILSDMRGIQNALNDDAMIDGWKPLPVPLHVNDQLVRLQFFYRHGDDRDTDDDADQSSEKHDKTRFILNVPKTGFGDVQIDGLVHYKEMDMIVRTENALSSQAELDMRVRYKQVMETTGMIGSLHFQSGRNHYVHV